MKRLVTRSDFDGLVCAMLLKELNIIEEIKFVHPKDVQDGKVELSENDITTNLPFDKRVGLAFDHHESEIDRLRAQETGHKLVIDPNARSAARVVYDYYGGKAAFPGLSEELLAAVDKGDSADFTVDEILNGPSKKEEKRTFTKAEDQRGYPHSFDMPPARPFKDYVGDVKIGGQERPKRGRARAPVVIAGDFNTSITLPDGKTDVDTPEDYEPFREAGYAAAHWGTLATWPAEKPFLTIDNIFGVIFQPFFVANVGCSSSF